MIYLDNNATTRALDSVWETMRPFFVEQFVNPASAIGQFMGLDRQIAAAKANLARTLGGESGQEFVITSGATEANNLALLGAAHCEPERRHVIISSIEHPSVLEVADHLERVGYRITRLPVTSEGLVTLGTLESALSPDTLLVSVMLANNETGVVQPIASLANAVKQVDSAILFHTDATQAVGKVPIDLAVEFACVDLLSFSAHKFHGPKGVGALFVRDARSIQPITFGGGQQLGLRPGTENPAAVAAMSAALSTVVQHDYVRIANLRDLAERELSSLFSGAKVLGRGAKRLPNTSKIHLPGHDGDELVDALAACGVAVSTGSACAHGARKPSHVAMAMGLSYPEAQQCIRVSLAFDTAEKDVREFVRLVAAICESGALSTAVPQT